VILEGLPSDYAPVVSVIESRFDLLDLDEVEVLLLASFVSTSLRSKPFLMCPLSTSYMLLLIHHLPHQKKVALLPPNRILHILMNQSITLYVVEAVVEIVEVVAVVVAILIYNVKCALNLAIVP
jgi:hypothetical protein